MNVISIRVQQSVLLLIIIKSIFTLYRMSILDFGTFVFPDMNSDAVEFKESGYSNGK